MAVSVVHRVGSRRKGFPCLSSIRSGTSGFSVYHIGSNSQDGSGRDTAPVGVVAFYIGHKFMDDIVGNAVSAVVIIAVFWKVSFHFVVYDNTVFVPDGLYFCVFDGGKRICHYGEACDSRSEPAGDFFVVESHLDPFIAVFVMHIMNDIQGIYIDLRQPFHHIPEPVHNLFIVQILRGNRAELGPYLFLGNFIHPSVDRVKQAFGQICPGAEKLHFLSDPHGRYTAGNGVVVAVGHPHKIIIFILDRRGSDGGFCAETFEIPGQSCRPQHSQVRFRRRSQIFQGVEIAVGHFGHHMPPVDPHAADGFCDPGRISGKQSIVFRGPGKFYQTQFHDKMIYKLLDLSFCESSIRKIPLGIDIQESRGSAQRHGGAVLFFDSSQITKIQPLNSFPDIGCGPGNIEAVNMSQFF